MRAFTALSDLRDGDEDNDSGGDGDEDEGGEEEEEAGRDKFSIVLAASGVVVDVMFFANGCSWLLLGDCWACTVTGVIAVSEAMTGVTFVIGFDLVFVRLTLRNKS